MHGLPPPEKGCADVSGCGKGLEAWARGANLSRESSVGCASIRPVEKSWACACKSRLARPTLRNMRCVRHSGSKPSRGLPYCAALARPALLKLFNFLCRARTSLCKVSHFAGDHAKTASLFARARRFYCCIERQTVGLEGNSLNDRKNGGGLLVSWDFCWDCEVSEHRCLRLQHVLIRGKIQLRSKAGEAFSQEQIFGFEKSPVPAVGGPLVYLN
jgi:hypothetical protein